MAAVDTREQRLSCCLVHAEAIVGHGDEHIVAVGVGADVDVERPIVAHGVAHRVLHHRLHDERRHQHVAAARRDVLALLDTVLAKARVLEAQVAPRLLELARERDELVGALERLAIEDRELTEQRPGLRGVCAREGGEGVDRVEEEVRVDLRLQGLDLGLCRKLGRRA